MKILLPVIDATDRDLLLKDSRLLLVTFSNSSNSKLNLFIFYVRCPKCRGKGKMIKKNCHVCQGNKIVKGLEEMSVYIEKGMPNGHEIVIYIHLFKFDYV
jgi:hypothetical protein